MNGTLCSPNEPFTGGLCEIEPPGFPVKNWSARKRVVPAPMMLIATPDTMWSMPKVTVASACSRPPSIPPIIPPMIPAHGPQCHPA